MPVAAIEAGVGFESPVDRSDELRPDTTVRFLEIADRNFVMVDGEGPPAESAFAARMPGLYATAYGLRFALKRRGVTRRVGPLEGLWWSLDPAATLDAILGPGADTRSRDQWRWILMIGLPDEATETEMANALSAGRMKVDPSLRPLLRVEWFAEGRVAQVLHRGPYAAEKPTIERLQAAIGAAGLTPRGHHHEIYLGDPRRSAPERLKTLIRQAVS